MISTILVEMSRWVPLLFWVGVGALAAVAYWTRRMGWDRALIVVTVLSIVAAGLLVFLPESSPVPSVTCAVQFSVPFSGIDTLANIGLLYPAVLFAAVRTRRPVLVAVAGVALSLFIEAVQALVPAIGRSCDTNDVLMNTVGVLMGAGIGALVGRAASRASRRP